MSVFWIIILRLYKFSNNCQTHRYLSGYSIYLVYNMVQRYPSQDAFKDAYMTVLYIDSMYWRLGTSSWSAWP